MPIATVTQFKLCLGATEGLPTDRGHIVTQETYEDDGTARFPVLGSGHLANTSPYRSSGRKNPQVTASNVASHIKSRGSTQNGAAPHYFSISQTNINLEIPTQLPSVSVIFLDISRPWI
jgi:hypothetical protein